MNRFEDKIKEVYTSFKSNEKNIWLERMVYKKGKKMFTTASIDRFIKSQNPFEKYNHTMTVDELFLLIDGISKEYVSWSKLQDGADSYSELDFQNLENLFKGFMGEYFCYFYSGNITRFMTSRGVYAVRYMSPNGYDTGIDFYGLMNGIPSVIQVKWWNKYSKEANITLDIFQKLFADGVANDYIVGDGSQTKNLFLMWTGSENEVYKKLETFSSNKLIRKIVVIGEESWSRACLDTDTVFWEEFWSSLEKISE